MFMCTSLPSRNRLKIIFPSLSFFFVLQTLRLCHASIRKAVFQNEILLPDKSKDVLTIHTGEEPIDILYAFTQKHNLDQYHRNEISKIVCSMVKCTRTEAIVWTTTVSHQGSAIGTFELFENVEPVDAAHAFVTKHNLTRGYRRAILSEACEVVDCMRTEPVVWRKDLTIDGKLVRFELFEGEELADKIFSSLESYRLTFENRKAIMNLARHDGVACARDYAHILSEVVELDNTTEIKVDIFDNGKEPADVLYELARENNVTDMFQKLSDSVLPKICKFSICTRILPVVFTHRIMGGVEGQLGSLEIMKEEEPIDAIDRFSLVHGLDKRFRDLLMKEICAKITCTRNRPIVFQKDISLESKGVVGAVRVFEGEEVIDATVRFLRETNVPISDEIAFKNVMFNSACGHQRLLCTRNVAHIYDRDIKERDGKLIGKLTVTEHEEPVDKIFQFWKENKLERNQMKDIIDSVCAADLVICNRKVPVIFSLPLNGPDGEFVGHLGIQLDEEPVDAVYRFFAAHRLFEKNWDLHTVAKQICDLPQVLCKRSRAVKHYEEDFEMGGERVGQFVVWEDEEVIDKIYEKRVHFNLTLRDQMEAFGRICSKRDVECARTQAIVYELRDITKHDFEKFGNETCSRRYNGWKFLSAYAGSRVGSVVVEFAKGEVTEMIIGHPLFPLFSMISTIFGVSMFLSLPRFRSRVHIGHKIVVYFTLFIIVSFSQAKFFEPENEIDKAVHIQEGKLPDLQILENQEPVDAILLWAKAAAKDHHPIVREPIYWDIIDKVCREIDPINECTRRRAWTFVDMGFVSMIGITFKIEFFDPSVDPVGCKGCRDGKTELNRCVERAVSRMCERIVPTIPYPACEESLALHMKDQLEQRESRRFESKDTYVKLGLEMDAPQIDLYPAVASIVRSKGMNISPFARVDNGTATHEDWDIHSREAFAAMDAHHKVRDSENREWNDKPCTPYFGGALCAKTDKDGNMMIEV